MAEIVSYPEPHCIRCWVEEPGYGVMHEGKVIGPYCRACVMQKTAEINTGRGITAQSSETA